MKQSFCGKSNLGTGRRGNNVTFLIIIVPIIDITINTRPVHMAAKAAGVALNIEEGRKEGQIFHYVTLLIKRLIDIAAEPIKPLCESELPRSTIC